MNPCLCVSGVEVLCLVLKRLAYPCRYVDLQEFFNRPKTECNVFFLMGINFIYRNFSSRLTDWNQPWLTLPAIQNYCNAVFASGAPLRNCWGFVDGTVRQMCRPTHHQREGFSGHKRVHGLKFQSIVAPIRLIVNSNFN